MTNEVRNLITFHCKIPIKTGTSMSHPYSRHYVSQFDCGDFDKSWFKKRHRIWHLLIVDAYPNKRNYIKYIFVTIAGREEWKTEKSIFYQQVRRGFRHYRTVLYLTIRRYYESRTLAVPATRILSKPILSNTCLFTVNVFYYLDHVKNELWRLENSI